jgi:uncharacterized protein
MSNCFFVSDLHGKMHRYQKLFEIIMREEPQAVFLGGDLLPSVFSTQTANASPESFIKDVFEKGFRNLRRTLMDAYPRVFLILGNDDPRTSEEWLEDGEISGLWEYIHNRKTELGNFSVLGYACVPPTPFLLKDWERYDVSHFTDPGSIPLEEGYLSTQSDSERISFTTIAEDLKKLSGNVDFARSIFLFHSPPYQTMLDRAGLDNKFIDHVPLDVNIGSIAIKRFISERQPLLTLHGHVHESARLTGAWKDRIGRTWMFSAATEGETLALVRFNLENLEQASRELVLPSIDQKSIISSS